MNTFLTITGCITGGAAAAALLFKACSWVRWIVEGLRCQLRTEMTRTYYAYREEKRIREYEYEAFMLNYKAYKALHGNSFVKKLKETVETWEVIP